MSGLFEEFMKDVLEVEVKPISIPKKPPFFSLFLEEDKEKSEDMIDVLEDKRTKIENVMKGLQKQLELIDKRLAQQKQLGRKKDK